MTRRQSVAVEEVGRLLTIDEVAERLRVSVAVIRKWRLNGKGPQGFRLGGGCLRWDAADVETWLVAQRQDAQ